MWTIHLADALISPISGRERSRLRDFVFSPDAASRILELATSHERRPDPLPQRNGSRHRQAFLAGCGEKYALGPALPHLVTAPQRLDRMESHAKWFRRAPGTIRITVQHPSSEPCRASAYILTDRTCICIHIHTHTPTATSAYQRQRTIAPARHNPTTQSAAADDKDG